MSNETKQEQQVADQKLQAGTKEYLTTAVTVGGKQYTAADIGTVLQGRIDARNAVEAARAVYEKSLAAEAAQVATSKVLVARVRAAMLVMFAGALDVLTAMGLSERKARTTSVAVKAASLEKSAATRVARHTTGPVAKAKIHGVTTAPAVATPAIAPATPAGTGGGAPHS